MIPRVRSPYTPRELAALFEDVWMEVSVLEAGLALHRELVVNYRTAGALRVTAPITFLILGGALTDSTVLRVHRLLEPGARRGRRSASFETLLAHLPPQAAPLRRELRKTLTAIRNECKEILDFRHSHIAHRDYAIAMEEGAAFEQSIGEPTAGVDNPPPEARLRGRVLVDALSGFAQILTAISERCQVGMPYRIGDIDLDVDQLIARLRSAP
jgi:hypothetical protein